MGKKPTKAKSNLVKEAPTPESFADAQDWDLAEPERPHPLPKNIKVVTTTSHIDQELLDADGQIYLAGIGDFLRTGNWDQWEAVMQKAFAEPPERTRAERRMIKRLFGDPPVPTIADLWGINGESFNSECRRNGADRRDRGQAEEEGEYDAASHTALYIVEKLHRGARQGSKSAIAAIAEIARVATSALETLLPEHLDAIRPLAEANTSFPILISRHSDRSGQKYIHERLKVLNVGARAPINQTGFDIRGSERQPFKQAVHLMCERLFSVVNRERESGFYAMWDGLPTWIRDARKLPALTEKTGQAEAEAWFGVAWEALCSSTDGHPEHLPLLKELGTYKSDSVKKESIRPSRFANGQQRGVYDRLRTGWLARYSRTP